MPECIGSPYDRRLCRGPRQRTFLAIQPKRTGSQRAERSKPRRDALDGRERKLRTDALNSVPDTSASRRSRDAPRPSRLACFSSWGGCSRCSRDRPGAAGSLCIRGGHAPRVGETAGPSRQGRVSKIGVGLLLVLSISVAGNTEAAGWPGRAVASEARTICSMRYRDAGPDALRAPVTVTARSTVMADPRPGGFISGYPA